VIFNAARRHDEHVIFLSDPNEPHHLVNSENRKHFQLRMKQYFDHFLIDTPIPTWIAEGLPEVSKGGAIKAVTTPRP
jgi:hypothetical protein